MPRVWQDAPAMKKLTLVIVFLATAALVENAATTFSPISYGAAGNGTTDDTVALQACVTAAVAAKGIVDLGAYTFKTSSPINVESAASWPRGFSVPSTNPMRSRSSKYLKP